MCSSADLRNYPSKTNFGFSNFIGLMTSFLMQVKNAQIGVEFLFLILSINFVDSFANPQPPSRVESALNTKNLIPIYIDDVGFNLYTRENPNNPFQLTVGNGENLKTSNFNGSIPTKIITHGWLTAVEEPLQLIRAEFLKLDRFNIITVDWSKCAKSLRYEKAADCCKQVGNHIGNLIKFLVQEANLKIKDVHLIGHSLGAQAMAFVNEVLPEKPARITGLDPAGPHFNRAPPSERLSQEDADFVDTIHTCSVFLSTKYAIGTVDFFVNGGYNQPGCGSELSLRNFNQLLVDLKCNHEMVNFYYLKTISEGNRNKYIGKKCQSLSDAYEGNCNGNDGIMGYDAIKSPPGVYFVRVTEIP